MHKWSLSLAVVSALILSGCAKRVLRAPEQRVTLGYTDERFFAITHYDAVLDRGASTGWNGYAGRLAGRACGVDVNLQAEYHGATLRIDGFVKALDPTNLHVGGAAVGQGTQEDKPSLLEVRDHHTAHGIERTIDGKIGGDDLGEFAGAVDGSQGIAIARVALAPRRHEVELRLSFDHLSGKAGYRRFDLHAEGDTYVGTMLFGEVKLPFLLRGRGALWSMSPADQAVILPFVLTCLMDDRRLLQDVDLGYKQ